MYWNFQVKITTEKIVQEMELTFVLLFSLTFSGFVTATEYYSDVYDNVDVDSIFNSDRLFKQYLDCILEDGSCTADARNLKRECNCIFWQI